MLRAALSEHPIDIINEILKIYYRFGVCTCGKWPQLSQIICQRAEHIERELTKYPYSALCHHCSINTIRVRYSHRDRWYFSSVGYQIIGRKWERRAVCVCGNHAYQNRGCPAMSTHLFYDSDYKSDICKISIAGCETRPRDYCDYCLSRPIYLTVGKKSHLYHPVHEYNAWASKNGMSI